MKRKTWRTHHRWFGLVLTFFILMFCLSGLVLNHPKLLGGANVSRTLLPKSYRYDRWNQGLLRGTLRSGDSVLIYGNGGIWRTDSMGRTLVAYSRGLPTSMEHRNIRGLVRTEGGALFAAATWGLYSYDHASESWVRRPLTTIHGERISDITARGDSLVITGRSHIYLSLPPYDTYTPMRIATPEGYDRRVSLFRTIWLLHSGELFGIVGKLVVDAIAIVLIFLSITGLVYWFIPLFSRKSHAHTRAWLYKWHNTIGKMTILLTLFLSITGWFLRPPALILVARAKVMPVPFSVLASDNPWQDMLRMLRYDSYQGDWVLYSSAGYYSLTALDAIPIKTTEQPPTSVMGLNVTQQDELGRWVLGSFSGMCVWDRRRGTVTDYFTGKPVEHQQGRPVGFHVIAGYSDDIDGGNIVVEYDRGTNRIAMPESLRYLPMSLKALSLEIHTGRIYTFFGEAGILYIFVVGLAMVWVLWTGWEIRGKRSKKPQITTLHGPTDVGTM